MMKFGSKTQEKLKMIKCFPSMEMLPLKGFMVLHSVYSIGTFFFVHKHFIHSLERKKKKKKPKNLVCVQFLPGKSHGQGSLVGYSPQGHKDQDMTEQLNTHTHSLNPPSLFLPYFYHSLDTILVEKNKKSTVFEQNLTELLCVLYPLNQGQAPAGKTKLGRWKEQGRVAQCDLAALS